MHPYEASDRHAVRPASDAAVEAEGLTCSVCGALQDDDSHKAPAKKPNTAKPKKG